ncbi:MAG: hypothetical protein WC829_23420 [Hyphomicrobium sp.]|jgi:hypothetical protein
MAKQIDMDAIALRLRAEARVTAEKLAPALFPKNQLGMKELSNDEYMEYVARHWKEPNFRATQLKRIGSRAFLDLTNDLFLRYPAEQLVPPGAAQPPQPGVQPAPQAAPAEQVGAQVGAQMGAQVGAQVGAQIAAQPSTAPQPPPGGVPNG